MFCILYFKRDGSVFVFFVYVVIPEKEFRARERLVAAGVCCQEGTDHGQCVTNFLSVHVVETMMVLVMMVMVMMMMGLCILFTPGVSFMSSSVISLP